MLDQYRYVGPALFVLRTMPDEARLVRDGFTGSVIIPKDVWIDVIKTWVRLNGEWISGWDGGEHFGFRPHWLNRWKLRRAGRRWLAQQPNPLPAETHSARPGACRGGSPTTAAAAFVQPPHSSGDRL